MGFEDWDVTEKNEEPAEAEFTTWELIKAIITGVILAMIIALVVKIAATVLIGSMVSYGQACASVILAVTFGFLVKRVA